MIQADRPDSKSAAGAARRLRVCVGLGVLILAIYAQTLWFDFIALDDGEYIYENQHVANGLTTANAAWAFSGSHGSHWHPLTSLVHLLDVTIFKMWPGGHHLVNVVIHAATAMVLFLALTRLTGDPWPSAFAAAVFAVHPLRVESVAWIAELKDVLSGLFFAFTLLAYARYIRRPNAGRYAAVMLAFGLGLLAKPMLVTTPFVLLLLDYWPLGRLGKSSMRGSQAVSPTHLIVEKLPLLALAILSAVATLWAQSKAMAPLENISPAQRGANAVVSYAVYLRQLAWPADLAVFYPHPKGQLPAAEVLAATALLMAITAATLALRRRWPFLVVGWFWYLGMLIPVIGLIQVGAQARADRFTYLSQIGPVIAVTWWLAALVEKRQATRSLVGAGAIGLVIGLSWLSWRQARLWRDTVTLFTHTVACTPPNAVAHLCLGVAWQKQGRDENALAEFEKATAIVPRYTEALFNSGMTLIRLGRFEEATIYLRRGLELEPDRGSAQLALGIAQHRLGRFDDAASSFEKASALGPPSATIYNELGLVRIHQGRPAEAIVEFQRAIRLDSNDSVMFSNLGLALYQFGRPAEALAALREALHLRPDNLAYLLLAAWIAATSEDPAARSGAEAIVWAEQANRIAAGKGYAVLNVLAASYAEVGRFQDAVDTANQGLQSLSGDAKKKLVDQIRSHRDLYRSGSPLRTPPSSLDEEIGQR